MGRWSQLFGCEGQSQNCNKVSNHIQGGENFVAMIISAMMSVPLLVMVMLGDGVGVGVDDGLVV